MMRDTFAVEYLLAGMPLEEVSRLLGHSSVTITQKHYAPGYWKGSNVWLPVSAKRGRIWALRRTALALGHIGDIAHAIPADTPLLRAVHQESRCLVDDLGLL